MGLFGKAIGLVTGAHEREGLSVLGDALGLLGGSPRAERVAEARAFRAALRVLKAKGVVGASTEEEALRMIDGHESGGA